MKRVRVARANETNSCYVLQFSSDISFEELKQKMKEKLKMEKDIETVFVYDEKMENKVYGKVTDIVDIRDNDLLLVK